MGRIGIRQQPLDYEGTHQRATVGVTGFQQEEAMMSSAVGPTVIQYLRILVPNFIEGMVLESESSNVGYLDPLSECELHPSSLRLPPSGEACACHRPFLPVARQKGCRLALRLQAL